MSEAVDPTEIEGVVGVARHATDHFVRAVSAEQTVYILHSEKCRAMFADLRECPFSVALDRGIEHPTPWGPWSRLQNRPVRVQIVDGFLMPALAHPAPADPTGAP